MTTIVIRLGASAAGRCRRRIHLDIAEPDHPTAVSAAAQRAREELTEHRQRVLREVRAVQGLPEPGPHSRWEDSGLGWRRGSQDVVLAPTMSTATRSGSADVLVWMGDGYQPVIIRAHRTRDAGAGALCSPVSAPLATRTDPTHRARRNRADRLALAHHYRQLVELGCASTTARGGVIGRGSPTFGAGRANAIGGEDDGAVIVWHELQAIGAAAPSVLTDYDDRFDDRLAVAAAAAAAREPLALPSRIAECRRCSWWPRCSAELAAAADISLLLTGDDVPAARAAGIHTIPDLANLPRESLVALPFTVADPALAQVRARARQRGDVLVRMDPRSAIRRADVEVDVDAESYGEDGAYLWGAQLSGADVGLPAGYRSFVTWNPLPSAAQGEAFGGFFDYLMRVRAAAVDRGLSFAVFCYAKAAEERWMLGLARRYASLPGVPPASAVADFCASPQWIDLMSEIKRHFVLPGSLRLKELAASVGFSWRDPEPGGENSMAWYRAAIGLQPTANGRFDPVDRPGRSNPMADRVIRYNEDDVLATLAVRRWISEHLTDLPTVADLESSPAMGGTRPVSAG